jgi:hypothetical protein
MADQCIVCLENLDVQPPVVPVLPLVEDGNLDPSSLLPTSANNSASSGAGLPLELQPISAGQSEANAATLHAQPQQDTSKSTTEDAHDVDEDSKVAEIEVCGHMLHDTCLRAWTIKANSCPICRQAFHSVNVYDRVGGKSRNLGKLSSLWSSVMTNYSSLQEPRSTPTPSRTRNRSPNSTRKHGWPSTQKRRTRNLRGHVRSARIATTKRCYFYAMAAMPHIIRTAWASTACLGVTGSA